ncbi:hypothetical protein CA54_30370 [Symmachiella macrocystis]|uniref:LarA-like N-terminal domain-containing protein n=1 Tax=Symmachiella macrocystis TaxID=2527985 RepID=A0A5C6BU04_9PLAN|nr:lactate racemase domain-containing protein [Symmachiella macrocystis]TWU14194.1 hypothetical protein CA54_30370 [Symmachiella macrocystis]
MTYPRMLRIKQRFEGPSVEDIPATVESQLASLQLGKKIKPGETVAITAGSRGIANIAVIIKATVDHVKSLEAVPFIVPAMGSHGGGTPEGQRGIVEGYGITEDYTGAEIRSSMETVIVDKTPQGIPVHFDKHAYDADHVLVCGRVKPHTGFVGEIESGLLKMMLIGLGKHAGAKIYHRAILDYSFGEIITAVADSVLDKCGIVAGLAIVENAYDQTALLAAVAPENFVSREKELLKQAKQWMPRLPFDKVGLLIIDEIGKDISGSGMDTNVIGRKYSDHCATDKDDVSVKRIFVRGLTYETHGNACGLGLAEFTNSRTVQSVDQNITTINSLTGGHPSAAMIPVHYDSDREVLDAALPTTGLADAPDARVIHISTTLHVGEVLVSEAYLAEIENRDDLEIIDGPSEMQFDADGNLAAVAEQPVGV